MSNPISIYVGDLEEIRDAIERCGNGEIEEMPFTNLLCEDDSTDYWSVDLGDLITGKEKYFLADVFKFLSVISGNESDESQVDEFAFNLYLDANAIRNRYPNLLNTSGAIIAQKIYQKNEYWENEMKLADFLETWIGGMKKAAIDNSGFVWSVVI